MREGRGDVESDEYQAMVDKRTEHTAYIRQTGQDLPEIRYWTPTRR